MICEVLQDHTLKQLATRQTSALCLMCIIGRNTCHTQLTPWSNENAELNKTKQFYDLTFQKLTKSLILIKTKPQSLFKNMYVFVRQVISYAADSHHKIQ